MGFLDAAMILLRVIAGCCFTFILLVPAWWLAGRIGEKKTSPFFRLLCAIGLALTGFVSFVNLLGRVTGNSIAAVLAYTALNLLAGLFLWFRRRAELRIVSPGPGWRTRLVPILLAVVLAVPQWLLAVSTNYWDEAASSAIYLTAPSQFSEGLFPPRHNAFPDVTIKYHYAFTILSGTVKLLTGLSANVCTDLASTALWFFVFLFIYAWLRHLEFDNLPSIWGSFAVLLGGGLSWLYLPRLEAYSGWSKVPAPSELIHRYDAARSWLENLVLTSGSTHVHLRNTDGSISGLPWDIAAQFQQHAVSMGIALTVVALYVFTTWQLRKGFGPLLTAVNVACFSVLPLGHAVFGGVATVAAGLFLLGSWLRHRTRVKFYQGLAFGAGVMIFALLHGGMLTAGPEYGSGGFLTLRQSFGYGAGGLSGFLHWNVAGFGLPLLLAMTGLGFCLWRGRDCTAPQKILFVLLTIFGLFSYLVPQLAFYSSDTSRVEQQTEISKFFFSSHFALALLSVFGAVFLVRYLNRFILIPGFLAMAITPLAVCYEGSFQADGSWRGFYHSPYEFRGRSVEVQMGEELRKLKQGNRAAYFDVSADEARIGYISEMLIYGGSVFTLTPSRYERTGSGYRLAEQVVAQRYMQNSRMSRLLPGAAEAAACQWLYTRPFEDMAFAPLIVRSRFDKLVGQGYLKERLRAGARVLYSIEKPTLDLDRDIGLYWRPRIVAQARTDWDGDGKSDVIFFDYLQKRLVSGTQFIDLPAWLHGELGHLYVGSFSGSPKVGFLAGRMADTVFRLGARIEDIVQYNGWAWTLWNSASGTWQSEYENWLWDYDMPVLADLNRDGFHDLVAYRPTSKAWLIGREQRLAGPAVDAKDLPVPLAGRFLSDSSGDLGLWCLRTGQLTLKSPSSDRTFSLKWGGRAGDILVPGDYDGDGYDEIAIWQRTNKTWYWRHAFEETISQATFGSDTGIPLPWDYNHDGRLDLAYWEPREGKIYVSFDQGQSVTWIVTIAPNCLPAFVNMY